jgi:hypothetical protein
MARAARWIIAVTVTMGTRFFFATAHAHGPNDPPHQLYKMDDLKLESRDRAFPGRCDRTRAQARIARRQSAGNSARRASLSRSENEAS